MKTLLHSLLALLCGCFIAAADDIYIESTETDDPANARTDRTRQAEIRDIWETIKEISGTDIFVEAVEVTEMQTTINGLGPLTVFLPTDTAFNRLGKGTVDMLFSDEGSERLKRIIRAHTVKGKILLDENTPQTFKTLAGTEVTLKEIDGQRFLNGDVPVDRANIEATNGVVHLITELIEK